MSDMNNENQNKPQKKVVPPAKPVPQRPVPPKKPINANGVTQNNTRETQSLEVGNVTPITSAIKHVPKSKKVVFLSILCSVLTIALVSVALFMFVFKPGEHTITYLDVDMQTVYETITIKHGEELDSLIRYNTDNPNLIFMGWYLDDEYQDRISVGTKIERNYVLYPKFRYEYKISYYDANLSGIYKTDVVDHDDLVILEEGPKNDNEYAVFKGWYTDAEFNNKFVFGTTIDKDYTLYPKFENEYTIIYKDINQSTDYKKVVLGDNDITVEPVAPVHSNSNAIFKGWYTDRGFLSKFTFGTTINKNYTLYPLFELEFTITYMNIDLETEFGKDIYDKDDKTLVPSTPAHGNQYAVFKGWYIDKEFNNPFTFGTKIDKDYTLYPRFEIEYKIIYKDVNQTDNYKEEVYGVGVVTSQLTPPAHGNQYAVFKGWYTDKDFINKFEFGSAITQNYTLYPKFDLEYRLTYMGVDKVTIYKEEIYIGSQVTVQLPPPEHDDQYAVFKGWYTDKEFTNQFEFGSAITQHYTLYPKFENEYIITYKDIDHSTDYKKEVYHKNQVTVEPIVPSNDNTNAIFDGWYTESACINKFEFGGTITQHYTLYPLFISKFTITYFDFDLESVYKTETYEPESVTIAPDAPVHSNTNAEFVGWYTDKEFKNVFVFGGVLSADITLYPLFENLDGLAFTEIKDDNDAVIGYSVAQGSFSGSELTIPAYYNGKPVIEIAAIGFEDSLIEKLVLPDTIKVINERAFINAKKLTIDALPSELEVIGKSSFWYCSAINFASLPNTVTTIGDNAFFGTDITLKNLPTSLKTIGECAFQNCQLLEISSIPEGVESVGGGAFYGCRLIKEMAFPASVKSIGYGVFSQTLVTKITIDKDNTVYNDGNGSNAVIETETNKLITGCVNTTIPESVKIIGEWSLTVLSLNSFVIPSNVETIENNAFNSAFIDLIILLGETISLSERVFNECNPYSHSHNITYVLCAHDSMVDIVRNSGTADANIYLQMSNGFDDLEFATSVEISDEITINIDTTTDYDWVRIGSQGSYEYFRCVNFKNISQLTFTEIKDDNDAVTGYSVAQGSFSGNTLTIPAIFQGKPVTKIAESGFEYNTTLIKVVIPDSVEVVGAEAFQNCTNLESVTLPENITLNMGAFHNCIKLDFDTLPSGIVIGYMAFSGCASLTLDSLPSSVTEIGEMAFIDCTSLNLTSLPASLKVIGNKAFKNCTSLENLTLPSGLETIYAYAFEGCTKLNITSIPTSVTSLGRNVFNNCIGLTSVAIECNITNIPVGLFNGCSNLVSVTMPSGVEVVGNDVFAGCASLNLSSLPNTITSIGSNAFKGCTNLTLSSLPNGLISIGIGAFKGCTGITISSLPITVTTIGSSAFSGCTGITISIIPSGVETIGGFAFYGCNGIVSMVISNGVKTIDANAFISCKSLRYVELPSTIESLGQWSFNECTALKVVVIPTLIQSLDAQAFILSTNYEYVLCGSSEVATMLIDNNIFSERKIYIKQTSGYESLTFDENFEVTNSITLNIAKTTDYTWVKYGENYYKGIYNQLLSVLSFTEIKDGDNVVAYSVAQGSFSGSELTIPATYKGKPVTMISANGFKDNKTLTSVVLPDSITVIEDCAFYGCSNLNMQSLPSGLEKIGSSAFIYCEALTLEELPDSLNEIEYFAFAGSGVKFTSLPRGLTTIESSLFRDCQNIVTMSIPSNIESIGDYAFYDCVNLEEIELTSGLISIGSLAFYNCQSLESITLPQGLEKLGSAVFSSCTALTEIKIPASVTSIGVQLIQGSAISKIEVEDVNTIYSDGNSNCIIEKASNKLIIACMGTVIPNSVKIIAKNAFVELGIKYIAIPASVETIEEKAFDGCENLQLVFINGTSTIVNKAFNGCTSLNYYLCADQSIANILQTYGIDDAKIFVKATSGYNGLAFENEITLDNTIKVFINTTSDYDFIRVGESGNFEYYQCINYKNVSGLAFTEIKDSGNVVAYSVAQGSFSGSELSIPATYKGKPVTMISANGFKDNQTLESVIFPSTIEAIGNNAFYKCKNLALTSLPSGITSIGEWAFSACENLALTELPSGLTSIENSTFSNCAKLALTELPSGITSIGEFAFNQCVKLALTELPSGLISIGVYAFGNCANLALTSLPSGLISIGSNAFCDCTNLTLISLPSSLTSISNGAFYGCTNLVLITLPSGLVSIGSNVFNGCSNLKYILCESNTVISLVSASGVEDTKIFVKTTSGYNGLAFENEITLDNTIKVFIDTTSDYDFIRVGESETFEYYQCINCKNVLGLEFTEIKDGDDVVAYSVAQGSFSGSELTIPETYKDKPVTMISANGFKDNQIINLTMSNNIISIGEYAFDGCLSLTTISFSSSLVSIGEYAFNGCGNLELTALPSGVTEIGIFAFAECRKLSLTYLPSGLTSVNEGVFNGCTGLIVLSLQSGLETIGNFAFNNCTSLQYFLCESNDLVAKLTNISIAKNKIFVKQTSGYDSLVFSESIDGVTDVKLDIITDYNWVRNGNIVQGYTYYKSNLNYNSLGLSYTAIFGEGGKVTAFKVAQGTCALTDITILPEYKSKPITQISDRGFEGNKNITRFNIASNLTTIGNYAFSGCTKLERFTFVNSITTIGKYAFYECSKLAIQSLADSVEVIDDYAFYNCEKITLSKLPSSLTKIGNYAFFNGDGLTITAIPNNVTSIGDYAFTTCDALLVDTLSTSLKSIGAHAFAGCPKITLWKIPEGVVTIGAHAFGIYRKGNILPYYCSSIKMLYIPSTVTTIGTDAFGGVKNLEYVLCANSEIATMIVNYGISTSKIYVKQATGFSGLIYNFSHTLSDNIVVNLDVSTEYYWLKYQDTHYKSLILVNPEGLEYTEILDGDNKIIGYSVAVGLFTGTNLNIPAKFKYKPVTHISENGFKNITTLSTVTLPSSLTTIGANAFNGCTALKITSLPIGVENIGDSAFRNCTSLAWTSITGVETIGNYAFYGCSALALKSLPTALTSIGNYAFAGCTAININKISSNVASIGEYVFSGVELGLIILPESLTIITQNAFADANLIYILCPTEEIANKVVASGVEEEYVYVIATDGYDDLDFENEIVINSSLTINTDTTTSYTWVKNGEEYYKGIYAHEQLEYTEIIDGSGNVIAYSVGQGTFKGSELVIPAEYNGKPVTTITNNGFYNNTTITNIEFPSSITAIGDYAFNGCANLTLNSLPNTITSMGINAFAYCNSLTLTSLPTGIIKIEGYAFYNCTNLALISLPSGLTSIDAYAFSNCGKLALTALPSGLTLIGNSAFSGCRNLALTALPSGVTSIGNSAFSGCNALALTSLPNGVTVINNSAFSNCTNLALTSLPNSLTSIGSSAFSSCTKLALTSLPNGITSIGYGAFYACSNLALTKLPSGLVSLGPSAFSNCSKLALTSLPSGLTSIAEQTFMHCTALPLTSMPNGITSIGYQAFYQCTSLAITSLPSELVTIGYNAFYNCTNIKSLTMGNKVTTIENCAFILCTSLSSITLSTALTTIDYGAFYNCRSLTSIVIPSGVTCLSEQMFALCVSLKYVEIPSSVTSIGGMGYVFEGCTSLEYVLCGSATVANLIRNDSNYADYGLGFDINTRIYVSQTSSLPSVNSAKTIGNITFYTATSGGYKWVRTTSNKYYKSAVTA